VPTAQVALRVLTDSLVIDAGYVPVDGNLYSSWDVNLAAPDAGKLFILHDARIRKLAGGGGAPKSVP
jgi:hypothetical protein